MPEPTTSDNAAAPSSMRHAPRTGWKRVLLKLSGEAFAGRDPLGIDPEVVQHVAEAVAEAVRYGVQVAVVCGGGNMFRGATLAERGMDRGRGDYMGMIGTVINCLALQDFLEKLGLDTRVQTAITMSQVAEPYIPGAPSGTWRRAAWSSSARGSGSRSSPPTPPRRSAPWRSVPRRC